MKGEIDPKFLTAGFVLARMSRWERFVSCGELGRMLARTCQLVASKIDLGFQLTTRDGRIALTISIDGEDHAIAMPVIESESSSLEATTGVLRSINDVLVDAGSAEQLVIADVPRTAGGYRVLFIAPNHIPAERALGWYVEKCLSTKSVRLAIVPGPLAVLAPLDARLDTRLDHDGSLPGLVATYAVQIARFAGLDTVTCEPRWHQEPDGITLQVTFAYPSGGSSTRTVHVAYHPELDVQPILDTLNSWLDEPGAKHVYRVARDPERIQLAMLDKATAAELRREGELIEHSAREALRVLADAGFELSSFSGKWQYSLYVAERAFEQLVVLAAGIVELAFETKRAEDDGATITFTVAGRSATCEYPATLAPAPAIHVFARIVGDLNRLLAEVGTEHRVVFMSGAPYFYGYRMLLLDRAWLGRVAHCGELPAACLDPATRASLVRTLAAYPPLDALALPPRLARIDEIVSRDNILGHDFKCSCRPSDFPDLVEEIARFARVAIEVDHHVSDEGEYVAVPVSYRGESAIVRVANAKYTSPEPILDYLNTLLDTRKPRHQLFSYHAGGYSGGIVRATDEQAARLRIAGYIR